MASPIDPLTTRGSRSPSRSGERQGEASTMVRSAHRSASLAKSYAPRVPEARFWRVLCLVEIENFTTLRRHLGRGRADTLVLDVTEKLVVVAPEIRCATSGRSTLELGFECETPDDAHVEIERLREIFAEPLSIDAERHIVSLRFGAALAPAPDDDDVRLIEIAESALEQARSEGSVVIFNLSDDAFAFDKPALIRQLPAAIDAGEMVLQYQPKVHIRRQEIASAEALVRWQHPTHGLILPGEFIAAAEAGGQIGALTLWTLKQVIADQRVMAQAGHDIPVFINISGVLLADGAFVEEACAIVRDGGARIGFEITETSVIRDPDVALRHLQRFVDIGVPVAIDDYGAGLSSLAYLKQLPATELKIDKMFVMQLTSSNRDPLIVRSTIDLAHAMEMEVTAEGVETPAALALLSVMGCDLAQGFLISRPVGFDAFLGFLEQDGHLGSTSPTLPSFAHRDEFWKRG